MFIYTKRSIIIKKKGREREKIGKYGIRYNIFTLYNKHGLPKKNWKERNITAQLKKKNDQENMSC